MNSITIIGKVGQDPELRATANGKMICTFSVATTSGKDDKKKTVWHNVTAFGDMAEHAAESIRKGSNVIAVGKFDVDEYETKQAEKRKSQHPLGWRNQQRLKQVRPQSTERSRQCRRRRRLLSN